MNTPWRIPLTALTLAAVGACSDTRDVTAPGPLAFSHATDEGTAGALYVATNATTSNAILVFPRASDGTLSAPSAFVTGGMGSGGGLGNQGGVSLTRDHRWLLVVNAGSNEVSVFAVKPDGLELTDRVFSGGAQPVSVTAFRELVYVLNAGGTGNITGFRLTEDGRLRRLRHSGRPLSSGAAGAAPGGARGGTGAPGSHCDRSRNKGAGVAARQSRCRCEYPSIHCHRAARK